MAIKSPHPQLEESTDVENTMSAVEAFAQQLFEQADNDTMYHHPISSVRIALAHGKCFGEPDELAERILAWSGAL